MPSVTRRRAPRERRDAVERQVLEAVERLLAAGESFTALPVQRIADEAGIARTTFYGHLPDKPGLLMQLITSATRGLFEIAAAWVDDDTADPAAHEATVLALVREHRAHAPLLRALAEVAAYEPEVEAFWRDLIDGFADRIRRRLERDRRAGRVAADLDARVTASWIAWGTERTLAVHVATRPPREDAAFAKGVSAATLAAMRRT